MSTISIFFSGLIIIIVILVIWIRFWVWVAETYKTRGSSITMLFLGFIIVILAYVSNPNEANLNTFVRNNIFKDTTITESNDDKKFADFMDAVNFSGSYLSRYNLGWISINDITTPSGESKTVIGIFSKYHIFK